MVKKILGLGNDGKLVLSLPGGRTTPLPPQPRVFLLVDCSGSMQESKITQAAEGALVFAKDAHEKQYLVGLITFASEAKLLCRLENNLSLIASTVKTFVAWGGTNMTDGIKMATAQLEDTGGIRAIVIVTDGEPDNRETALEAASCAKRSGIDIIAIGTDDADQSFLQQIASRSALALKVSSTELLRAVANAAKFLPKTTR